MKWYKPKLERVFCKISKRRNFPDRDNIFINNADEEALRTGGPPIAGPSRRSHSPHPLHVPMPVPRLRRLSSAERLTMVPIEVPDENEEGGFHVVLAVDLTREG